MLTFGLIHTAFSFLLWLYSFHFFRSVGGWGKYLGLTFLGVGVFYLLISKLNCLPRYGLFIAGISQVTLWIILLLGVCGDFIALWIPFNLVSKVVIVTSFLGGILGFWQAVKIPEVRKEELVFFEGIVNPLKVVLLSDLHVGCLVREPWLQMVVNKVNSLSPDLILFTGDLIDDPKTPFTNLIPLKNLRAKYGAYFILGNHENYLGKDYCYREFRKLGLILLENRSVMIEHEGKKIVLGGVNGGSVRKLFNLLPDNYYTILMAHYPVTFKESVRQGVRLQLSGHTHGGQFFPLTWFVTKANKGFLKGWYSSGVSKMYVSRGTGLWAGLPLRLGIKAEITLLMLRGK